ncbi:MAG TPA: ectoine hydroxylase [Pseudonocardiaceae bacterium]|jgi:ectoine hydroxylase|nr:ectoine hydroxylase [Pseudonocardiaceae bacterium]
MTVTDTRDAGSRTEDRYPTRLPGTTQPIPRTDPTVWSTDDRTGPFAPAELAGYAADGYSIVEGLLSPAEVHTYQSELARLAADPKLRKDERIVVERESDEVRSIFEVHKISGLIDQLVHDPRLQARARQILGSDVYVHQSRVNYLPGFKGKGFYWHSDFETWHAEDGMPLPRACSISVALTENFPFNGGLMVLPGSHRTFVPCVGATPDNNYQKSLQEQEIGVPSQQDLADLTNEYGIDQFTGPAGSALVFDSNIMHGSGNNITPLARSNIFVVFNSVENALIDPYAADQPRPDFIASRDFTPLSR